MSLQPGGHGGDLGRKRRRLGWASTPRDPARGYWSLWTLCLPLAPPLLPDYSPRASPIFLFLQASPQNPPLPVERAARGSGHVAASYHHIIVAVHHEGVPASKVDVFFPPVAHLWGGGRLGLGYKAGCGQARRGKG